MASNAASQQDLDALVSGLPAGEAGAEGEGGKAKKKGGKLKLLLIALPIVLILGGAGAYFAGLLDPLLGKGAEEGAAEGGHAGAGAEAGNAAEVRPDPIFFDMPDLLVNLHTTGNRAAYLKIKLSLQFSDPAVTAVLQKVQPRLIDSFQIYLRELRLEDLEGSAGLMRLKEELLARANQMMAPAAIDDVLFKEMLVQ
ncbi:flagellar basal body-associated FliL family protein [Zavarzinia aquatilis]|uniref:Flagellar protein FliL n=1 Tax=Zavarzinia aquatilis TaxID=2211142 RepID=A0A317E7C0_9PROT|nr:flagellar basal body-associated FliL family protein [Zavarzinia aquatilis]PWR22947.1 flagellar basal body protein FliL [Zavarzinia aquatilis]